MNTSYLTHRKKNLGRTNFDFAQTQINNMKATITYIELNGPLKFFALSAKAMKIIKQLKATDYKAFKKQGIWKKHYTMTLWKSEEELQTFARSGAHLDAMSSSKSIAKVIKTYTYDTDELPSWKEAKILIEKGREINY